MDEQRWASLESPLGSLRAQSSYTFETLPIPVILLGVVSQPKTPPACRMTPPEKQVAHLASAVLSRLKTDANVSSMDPYWLGKG